MKPILLGCLGLVLTGGFFINAGDGPAPKSIFQSHVVKRGSLAVVIQSLGELQPEVSVEVSTTVPGTIWKLGTDPFQKHKKIDFNSVVKEGTILAQLDPAPFEAELASAKAELQRAEVEVRLAKAKAVLAEKELLRMKKRQADKMADATEVEVAAATHEVARLTVVSAEIVAAQKFAALTRAEQNLSNTTIRSPINGIVIERRCQAGQVVAANPNAPGLFLIASDLKKLQIWAFVRETDIRSVASGQTVQFTVNPYPYLTFKGQVAVDQPRLNAALNKEKGEMTYTVLIDVENPDRKLLPFLTTKVQFHGVQQNVPLVPKAALRWFPQPQQVVEKYRVALSLLVHRPVVWVEDKRLVRPVLVKTGQSDGLMTEIVEGELPIGARVVTGMLGGTGPKK